MDNNEYIKISDAPSFNFSEAYKQCWNHPFDRNRLKVDYVYVKTFAGKTNEKFYNESLAILEFLYLHKFATFEQLKILLKNMHLGSDKLDTIMHDLIISRVCNAFALTRYPMQELPKDALKIYTLDFGAKTILSHFGKKDVAEWVTADVMRSSSIIAKYIAANQFYLALFSNKGSDLAYFKPVQDYFVGTRTLRTSAEFAIKEGASKREFILETFRECDFPMYVREKVEKLENFYFGMGSKHLHRYFVTAPILIVLAENEDQILEAARIINRISEAIPVRYIIDDSTIHGIVNTSFYKYKPDVDSIIKVSTSLFV